MTMRGRKLLVGALLFLSVVIAVGAFAFLSYSRDTYIDIMSGRMRRQTRVGPFVLEERIDETAFSESVRELCPGTFEAQWRPVITTSNFDVVAGRRTCYRYTSLPGDLNAFVLLWQNERASRDRVRREGGEILQLLQQDKPEEIEHRLSRETSPERVTCRREGR